MSTRAHFGGLPPASWPPSLPSLQKARWTPTRMPPRRRRQCLVMPTTIPAPPPPFCTAVMCAATSVHVPILTVPHRSAVPFDADVRTASPGRDLGVSPSRFRLATPADLPGRRAHRMGRLGQRRQALTAAARERTPRRAAPPDDLADRSPRRVLHRYAAPTHDAEPCHNTRRYDHDSNIAPLILIRTFAPPKATAPAWARAVRSPA